MVIEIINSGHTTSMNDKSQTHSILIAFTFSLLAFVVCIIYQSLFLKTQAQAAQESDKLNNW